MMTIIISGNDEDLRRGGRGKGREVQSRGREMSLPVLL